MIVKLYYNPFTHIIFQFSMFNVSQKDKNKKFSLSQSRRLCLSVSRFYGLYHSWYGSDFDETWWKYWNLRNFHENRFSDDVITFFFFFGCFFAKGQKSAAKGNITTTALLSLTMLITHSVCLTWNQEHSASVNSTCSVAGQRIVRASTCWNECSECRRQ